jgi:hypothetical protein
MCPANGELESRDPEQPVDYLCRVAHLRARVFDVDVPAHGECEYCAGGPESDWVEETASDLRAGRPSLEPLPEVPPPAEAGCGTGGCSSCGVRDGR